MMPVDKSIQTKTSKNGALEGMHKNFIDAKSPKKLKFIEKHLHSNLQAF